MAKKFWKIINGRLWQYNCFRSGRENARRKQNELRYERIGGKRVETTDEWDETNKRYNIFIRPRDDYADNRYY